MSDSRFTSHYLDAYLASLDDPPMLREAKALHAKVSRMQITVAEGSRIVGEFTYEPFDFSYAGATHLTDLSKLEESSGDGLASFRENVHKVMPKADTSHLHETFTDLERDASSAGLAASINFGGHMTFDYRRILELGVPGLRSEIECSASRYADDSGKAPFFEAMRTTLDAIAVFVRRHADEAERTAQDASGQTRERLMRIANDCRLLCEEPPRTFSQAFQLLWFLHILNDYDSFGRVDWALDHYYAKDLADGTITREEAGDLLEDIWPRIPGIENMTIGGLDAHGLDCCSDLTLLIIEVMEKVGRSQPNLCLRVHQDTPQHIWDAAIRCIGSGVGCPAIYNDDLIVPTLIELGIGREDALGYSLAGCSQVVIPGRSNFGCDDGLFNAAKCFELALHDGVDPVSGKRLGPSTGKPESLRTYDDLLEAFREQVAAAAELHRSQLDKADTQRGQFWGYPLRSLLTQDCLANAAGIWQGGARYNAIQTECIGITNAADSLAALKKMVFEDQAMSLARMVKLLDSNWKDAEPTRLACLNRLPKFGNDDPEADEVAAEVAGIVWEEIGRHWCTRGDGWIIPGGVVFVYQVHYGNVTGATPDGRRSGDPLADSSGPAQGRDRKGPTAVMKSVCKLPLNLAATCAVVNMKFGKRVFADEASRAKMRGLFKTYIAMGGMQLQVTVVDKAELLEAQRNPEAYRGLTVRVGGYSAYFNDLPREFQDEIISRTESV